MRMFRNEAPVQDGHLVQRRYDFYGDDTVSLDYIPDSGTVVRAFSNQIYLASTASNTNDAYNGFDVRIDSGSGSFQALGITDYTVQSVTNLLTRSEEFDHADWTNIGSPTLSANTTVAPDGTTTADTIGDDSVADAEGKTHGINIPADTIVRCASIFIKKDSDGTRFPGIHLVMGNNRYRIMLNTVTGEVANYTGTVATDFGVENLTGYWRIWISGANDGSATLATSEIYPALGISFGSEDVSAQGTCISWGAQLEQASTAGGYVPTSSDSATETVRICDLDGDWVNIPNSESTYSILNK